PRPVAGGDGDPRPGHRLVRPPAPHRGRDPPLGSHLGGTPQGLPLAGLAGRPRRGGPARLPVDTVLRLRGLHRLRHRARGRLGHATRRRQPGHRPGPAHGGRGAGRAAHLTRRRARGQRCRVVRGAVVTAGAPVERIRIRFSKLGKVRFTSHRDVARIWERALRRADLPIAYTEGFAPRPKLSFGLALSTGHESLGEYVDVAFPEGEVPVDLERLPELLSPALPAGIEVQTVQALQAGAPSLQQAVTS